MELDTLATHWQWTLDAASHAHHAGLGQERAQTAALLHHWLPSAEIHPVHLGLPPETTVVLVEAEGVLTDADAVQAEAWARVLDEVILHHADETGRAFVPFDRHEEYRLYLDARPRLGGLRAFLASRGIELSARELDALAARKARWVRGSAARPGAHRYLLACGYARLRRVAIAESAHTATSLETAGLAHLVEARVRPVPEALAAAGAAAVVRSDVARRAALEAGVPVVDAPASLAALLAPSLR